MGDRQSAGFTWPVPPEELSGVPVLVLDWTAEGRLTVREERPTAGASPRAVAPPGLRVAGQGVAPAGATTSGAASVSAASVVAAPLVASLSDGAPPRTVTLAETADTARIALPPPVRERVTWLGIGMLAGLVLAVSTLPDAGSLSPSTRRQPEGPLRPLPLAAPAGPGTAAPSAPALSGTSARSSSASAAPGTVTPSAPTSAPPVASATLPVSAPPSVLPAALSGRASASPASHVEPRTGNSSNATPRGTASGARVSTPLRVTHAAATTASPAPRAASHATAAPAAGAVLREVHRYEAALSRLDASAAHAARPGVDREAFARAFTALREQRLRLDGCTVAMPGESATVSCRGRLDYRPRVGDHTTRTSRGVWRFTLARDDARWVIEDVRAPAGVVP